MNNLLSNGLLILSGIIGGCLFIGLRNVLIKKFAAKLPSGTVLNSEPFNLAKFVSGMTTLKSGTSWAKDIHDIFNLRKLIIIGVIISVIAGYSYYQGHIHKPVNLVINLSSSGAIQSIMKRNASPRSVSR